MSSYEHTGKLNEIVIADGLARWSMNFPGADDLITTITGIVTHQYCPFFEWKFEMIIVRFFLTRLGEYNNTRTLYPLSITMAGRWLTGLLHDCKTAARHEKLTCPHD